MINKLAAGTANTTFQFKIIPIWDRKEHPKPMFIINQGFSTGGQRWALRWSAKQEITGADPFYTSKKLQRTLVIHFFILSVGPPVWICHLFFILWWFSLFFFFLQQHLLAPILDETSFCCGSSCILLSLSRVLCLTKACCTHRKAGGVGGGFIKARVRWTQQQWIKVFCMIKSLPRGGINLICERMLLRGNKVPKSSVILSVMS